MRVNTLVRNWLISIRARASAWEGSVSLTLQTLVDPSRRIAALHETLRSRIKRAASSGLREESD